jgi:hypothetical protein
MPDLIRHPEPSKKLDSGLRTAGMTDKQQSLLLIFEMLLNKFELL